MLTPWLHSWFTEFCPQPRGAGGSLQTTDGQHPINLHIRSIWVQHGSLLLCLLKEQNSLCNNTNTCKHLSCMQLFEGKNCWATPVKNSYNRHCLADKRVRYVPELCGKLNKAKKRGNVGRTSNTKHTHEHTRQDSCLEATVGLRHISLYVCVVFTAQTSSTR